MGEVGFGNIVGVFGVILVGLGIAWLIAQNWHHLPAVVRIVILLAALIASYICGVELRLRGYPHSGASLILLGSLLFTLSVFLIAQIFSTSTTLQGTAWLLFLCWIGVITAAYIFDSRLSLVVGFVEFFVWFSTQYGAFMEQADAIIAPALFGYGLLFVGVLLYGLSLWHEERFATIYHFFTVFYFLFLTYILSFQSLLGVLWPSNIVRSELMLIMLGLVGVVSLVVLISGILHNQQITKKELYRMLGIVISLALLLSLTIFAQEYHGIFRNHSQIPFVNFLLWIVNNLVFIGVILVIVGYGTVLGNKPIINMAIAFFALDIFTRYIGFVINMAGYFSLALIFISGGLVLIGGGWLIERWRRKLVQHV